MFIRPCFITFSVYKMTFIVYTPTMEKGLFYKSIIVISSIHGMKVQLLHYRKDIGIIAHCQKKVQDTSWLCIQRIPFRIPVLDNILYCFIDGGYFIDHCSILIICAQSPQGLI